MHVFATPRIFDEPIARDDELDPTHALQAVAAWMPARAPLLVLSGDVGTGKSFAAAVALHRCRQASVVRNPWGRPEVKATTAWLAAPHLARFQAWDKSLTEIDGADMLVIDDLGEEDSTPKVQALVSSLITTRCAYALRTVITTNLDGGTFASRYGQRIIDRLREGGLENGKAKWWIRCVGPSLRGAVRPIPRPVPEEPTLDEMAVQFIRSIGGGDARGVD